MLKLEVPRLAWRIDSRFDLVGFTVVGSVLEVTGTGAGGGGGVASGALGILGARHIALR